MEGQDLEQLRDEYHREFLAEYVSIKDIEKLKKEYCIVRRDIAEVQKDIADKGEDDELLSKLEVLVIKEGAIRMVIESKGIDVTQIDMEKYLSLVNKKEGKNKAMNILILLSLVAGWYFFFYKQKN